MMNNQPKFNVVADCKNLLASVNIRVICLDQVSRHPSKNGSVLSIFRTADHTGSINLCAWDKVGDAIQPGDILMITNGYTNKYNNSMHLYTSQKGRVTKVDEFCMNFVEMPNISLPEPDTLPMGVAMRPPPTQ